MANKIRIKRSTTVDTPPLLEQGELAYSEKSKNLFIGTANNGQEVVGGSGTFISKDSPTLTGTPLTPTAPAGANAKQIANVEFVLAAIATLVASSPATLDTLKELADAIGNDPNFAATLANNIAQKLAKSSNLSDLTSAGAARTNLGLGTMATQNASAVSISGGSISSVVLDLVTVDGGTF